MQNSHKYDDIIHLSRPVSHKHGKMSMIDRGAQFSPFAALVGYDAVIQESARLTDSETELDESRKMILDRKLRELSEHPECIVTFLCFVEDERKSGGRYVPIRGRFQKIDLYERKITMEDGTNFSIDNIREIEGIDEDGYGCF